MPHPIFSQEHKTKILIEKSYVFIFHIESLALGNSEIVGEKVCKVTCREWLCQVVCILESREQVSRNEIDFIKEKLKLPDLVTFT